MLGGGTGLTPLCAIIEELVRWQSKPRTHLFFGGRTPDDLYHLDRLRALAEVHPWLEVTPVVEEGEVEGGERGTVIEAVLRRGNWSGHDIRISGSPAMIRTSVTRLLVIGTPLERIAYDPFTID
jgi:NAD(P)H-flavin reductase